MLLPGRILSFYLFSSFDWWKSEQINIEPEFLSQYQSEPEPELKYRRLYKPNEHDYLLNMYITKTQLVATRGIDVTMCHGNINECGQHMYILQYIFHLLKSAFNCCKTL